MAGPLRQRVDSIRLRPFSKNPPATAHRGANLEPNVSSPVKKRIPASACGPTSDRGNITAAAARGAQLVSVGRSIARELGDHPATSLARTSGRAVRRAGGRDAASSSDGSLRFMTAANAISGQI
jgi:hypothetical protein